MASCWRRPFTTGSRGTRSPRPRRVGAGRAGAAPRGPVDGGLSESKAVRKGFPQFASACLKAFHASPASRPPSWEFVEEVLTVHGATLQDLRDAERDLEDAERRHEAERQRSDDLRDELKRLRRETSELRAEKAQAEKKAWPPPWRRAPASVPGDAQRIEELERRLRKADKENEHLPARAGARPAGAALARAVDDDAEDRCEARRHYPEPSFPRRFPRTRTRAGACCARCCESSSRRARSGPRTPTRTTSTAACRTTRRASRRRSSTCSTAKAC